MQPDMMQETTQQTSRQKSKQTIRGLAYAASGVAMTCSYMMLAQLLSAGNVLFGGQIITYTWPAAMLLGSFTCARLWGHFYLREMVKAMSVMACGFLFLESVSVFSSYFSALNSLSAKEVMTTGKQHLWALLVAVSLSVIALIPAIGIEMMKGGEIARKKPGAALRVVK